MITIEIGILVMCKKLCLISNGYGLHFVHNACTYVDHVDRHQILVPWSIHCSNGCFVHKTNCRMFLGNAGGFKCEWCNCYDDHNWPTLFSDGRLKACILGYTSLYPIPLWEVNTFCFFADSPLVLQAVRPPMACIWRWREPREPERNL